MVAFLIVGGHDDASVQVRIHCMPLALTPLHNPCAYLVLESLWVGMLRVNSSATRCMTLMDPIVGMTYPFSPSAHSLLNHF
eukprot:1137704-Pelagomonas_calceolata.AAC.2